MNRPTDLSVGRGGGGGGLDSDNSSGRQKSGATDVPDTYCRLLKEGTIREFALLLSS
jgi:hypothetical protein